MKVWRTDLVLLRLSWVGFYSSFIVRPKYNERQVSTESPNVATVKRGQCPRITSHRTPRCAGDYKRSFGHYSRWFGHLVRIFPLISTAPQMRRAAVETPSHGSRSCLSSRPSLSSGARKVRSSGAQQRPQCQRSLVLSDQRGPVCLSARFNRPAAANCFTRIKV